MSSFFPLLIQSVKGWLKDNATIWCAALAYFTVFSLGPLLLVIISIVGLLLSKSSIEHDLFNQIRSLLGNNGTSLLETVIQHTKKPSTSVLGTIIGTITLILGATGVFGQLQQMLNHIWGVKQKPRSGIWAFIRSRLLNFSMIGVICFLLLVSLVASTAISAVATFTGHILPLSPLFLELVNFLVSFIITTLLFALIFKILPDVKIQWHDIWIGASVTALLFTIGKAIIGIYIGHSGVTSEYGAAASLIILLLWVYYSSHILFLGTEITKAYTLKHHGEITPSEFSVLDTTGQDKQPSKPRRNIGRKVVEGFVEGFADELIEKTHENIQKPKKKKKK